LFVRIGRDMVSSQRRRIVADVSTRQLPDGASLSADAEPRESVCEKSCELLSRSPKWALYRDSQSVCEKSPAATERTCHDDTRHLKVPSTASSCRTQVGTGQKQSGHAMTITSTHDVDGRRGHSASVSYKRDQREIVVSVRMAIIVVVFGGMWLGFFRNPLLFRKV